jgi:hypothetical protein
VAFKDQTLVQVTVLATVVILLLKVREVLIVILVLELLLEHLGTITTTIPPILHASAILEIQAEVEHTLVAGFIIILVKLALELVTL